MSIFTAVGFLYVVAMLFGTKENVGSVQEPDHWDFGGGEAQS
jgi:hypothetical protein